MLNDEFYNCCFTNEEQNYILSTIIENAENPAYHTYCGPNTKDNIFCLSLVEATTYFDSDDDRVAMPTDYAINNFFGDEYHEDGDHWWLRTLGNRNGLVCCVRGVASASGAPGTINYYGSNSYGNGIMVRPAMWISVDAAE